MTISLTRWVLWISLLVIVPLPVYGHQWGVLPVAYILYIVIIKGQWELANVAGQALIWALILLAITYMYGYWSARWEPRVRGSVMAITVFSLLIIVSSVEVFRPLENHDREALTLPWLYE